MSSKGPSGYLISLPERLLRSAAAVLGGSSLLLTETLFPDAVKGSTTYRVMVGNFQRFIIDQVAQVDYFPVNEKEQVIDDYIGRKLVGNVLELAGLLTMSFSPVWVFALAGDAAGGGKLFMDRLTLNLKQHGVIKPESDPKDIVGLLEAIQKASSSSASAVDMPPLSRQQLAELAGELRDGYGRMFSGSRSMLARFNALQARMERTARREGLSLEEVSGVMALDLVAIGRAGRGTTAAVGQTGAQLFGEKILASYERTLDELNSQGAGAYVSRLMKPFMAAAAAHFDPEKPTWTQERLRGRPAGESDTREPATGGAAAGVEETRGQRKVDLPADDDSSGEQAAGAQTTDEAADREIGDE